MTAKGKSAIRAAFADAVEDRVSLAKRPDPRAGDAGRGQIEPRTDRVFDESATSSLVDELLTELAHAPEPTRVVLAPDTSLDSIMLSRSDVQSLPFSALVAERVSMPGLRLSFTARDFKQLFAARVGVGVGEATGADPTATNPTVEVSWSDDGGSTFSIPRMVKVGRQAVGKSRVRVNQCGISGSQGRIIKVRMSDPVHFGLMGGEMMAEVR